MKHILPSLVLFSASLVIAAPHASAQAASTEPAKSAKRAANKTAKPSPKKAAEKLNITETKEAAGTDDEDDKEPDIAGSVSVDYKCELGNNLTIFENTADDQHVALRWNKRLVRMKRVDTSTGANRFENRRQGLIWIGIPAKGMLLDSKLGRQLANECKNPEQLVRVEAPSNEPGMLESPKDANETTAPVASVKPAVPKKSSVPKKPAAPKKPQT